MSKAKNKTGPISPAEAAVITDRLAAGDDIPTIAKRLGRTSPAVDKWVGANLPRGAVRANSPVPPKVDIKKKLDRSLKWQYLREELTESEEKYFQEQYAAYMQQFDRDGVLPSEEDQIFQLISLNIGIHRNRRDVRVMREEIDRLQEEYRTLPAGNERADEDRVRAAEIDQSLGNLRHAEHLRNGEYLKMSAELKSLQTELKATRNQRINRIDSAKESFVDVLKKLQDPEYRDKVGVAAEFSRRATEREESRLSQWHEYEDGNLDQPILTAETALDEEQS